MKKIAIVTIYDNLNFGNKLQNYAVQTFFKNRGFEVITLVNTAQVESNLLQIKNKRRACIKGFSDEYLTLRSVYYNQLPCDFSKQFDYFVAGSDQVWHGWKSTINIMDFFFLKFAKPSQRLTFAPSFGFDTFPEEYLKTYKEGLEGFKYLSVREQRGAELIKELTGKDATVLLDPTMLIDTSEWLKILRKPSQYVDDNYIFVYSLGGFKGDVKDKTYALATDLGLQVIDIMDEGSDYYIHTRPDEFLYWIHNAKLIVTNSFHASVFSILFNRPFVVTERLDIKGMESRLDTLFEKFGISGRSFDELKDGFEVAGEARDRLFWADYTGVSAVLDAERKKADEFYKKCFQKEDSK